MGSGKGQGRRGGGARPLRKCTFACLDQSINLVSRVHGSEVKGFDYRTCIRKLSTLIRRRRKLLNNLPPHPSGGLLPLHHGRIPKVGLDKQNHFIISHQDFVGTDIVEPALHRCFYAGFIFFGPCARGGERGWDGGDEAFGGGGEEVLGQFHELRMRPANISKLRSAESWEVGLE